MGCAKLNRVVSASVPVRPLMHTFEIDCACGGSHRIELFPRKLRRADTPDLQLATLTS